MLGGARDLSIPEITGITVVQTIGFRGSDQEAFMHLGVETLTLALGFAVVCVTVQTQQSSTSATTSTAQKQGDAPRIPPAPAMDPSRMAKKSDPNALTFLRDHVDHTMYNLASQGAKDAVVHMRMPNNAQF